MDDISSKLQEILSDPQALDQIKGLAGMLGVSDEQPKQNKAESALSFLSDTQDKSTIDMLSVVGKIAPIMSNLNKEDDIQRLLFALRPFLSEERRKKLDQAEKIIKMMKLLPLIKDISIFDSLF